MDHIEEITLESLKKRQEVQEVMGEDCLEKDERKRRCMEAGTRRRNGDAGDQSRSGRG